MQRARTALRTILLTGGLLLAAAPALAQYWQGRAILEAKVSGARSGAVAGATVELTFLDGGAEPGPQGVTTDAKGEVVVSGLAEGRWRLRISHPEFFSYVTVILVQIGDKVEVEEAAHEASATGSGLLRVKFRKVQAGSGPAVPSRPRVDRRPPTPAPTPGPPTRPRPVPSEAVTEAPEATPPEPSPSETSPPEAPAAPSAPRPEVETGDEEASEPPVPPSAGVEALPTESEVETTPEPPAPAAPPTPVPSAPEPAPAETPDEADSLPSPAEPVEVEAPAPSEPAGTPEQETPAPERVVPPDPVAPAVESRPPAVVRSWDQGTCNDCRPGEAALSIDASVPAGTGSCADGAEEVVRSAGEQLAASRVGALRSFYGPVVSTTTRSAVDLIGGEAGTPIVESLAGLQSGSCQVLVAYLPSAARFTGYRYEARDFAAGGDCLPDQPCPIGAAQWLGNPGIVRGDGYTLIWATFSNRSADRVRHPRLSVYFKN